MSGAPKTYTHIISLSDYSDEETQAAFDSLDLDRLLAHMKQWDYGDGGEERESDPARGLGHTHDVLRQDNYVLIVDWPGAFATLYWAE